MAVLGLNPSREKTLRFLFEAAEYGNLGLFIGAGFSKAVLNNGKEDLALSWRDLLIAVAEEMKLDPALVKEGHGASYPEIASILCSTHATLNDLSFEDSLTIMKLSISQKTAWFPLDPERSQYSLYLRRFKPAWVITTNYDQVIECLLPGNSISLGPADVLSSARGVVPIIHLHGVRTNPSGIIIAQEDYVPLFRPTEYRQLRLSLTLKESTTCVLGYSLGDVNVLTALDWSQNVYTTKVGDYPHDVIQVLRSRSPKDVPYRSRHGILVVEVASLESFFEEFAEFKEAAWEVESKKKSALEKVIRTFGDAESKDVKKFIDNQAWRRRLLRISSLFSADVVADFETFLSGYFEEVKQRSRKTGGFEAYGDHLDIVIDVLTSFESRQIPPILMYRAAINLNQLASMIGDGHGYSWKANRTWLDRNAELSKETVAELECIANQYRLGGLSILLDKVKALRS